MSKSSPPRRLWGRLMAIGAYTGESASQAGRRRIVVGYILCSVPTRVLFAIDAIDGGRFVVGYANFLAAVCPPLDWWSWRCGRAGTWA